MSPTSSPAANQEFAELGLGPALLQTLSSLGYEEPTPIQREAIPHLLEGRDLLGLAATGTGKTAAFALPLLQLIQIGAKVPSALILVPTRELAVQVAQAVHRYGKELGVEVLPIYGGQSFQQQLKVLKRGVDVIVATPGRALDHLRRGTLHLKGLTVLVLDEADEMLDMGFAEDLEAILAEVPARRQTLLFSATLGPRIESIARKYLRDPIEVRIATDVDGDSGGDVPMVRQIAYLVRRPHKLAALGRVLDLESPEAALVFCRTRNDVDELTESLNGLGYRAEALHGGMSQEERDRVMKKLRGGTVDLLVATDVAARGLDISHLSHVINYEVPSAAKSYVHRIGRVGRAGREGVAITLAEPREHALLMNIERLTKQKIAVASIPTVADLHARRLELTRASVRESILEGGLDRFRVVVETLSDEFDLFDIALGAMKMGHEATLTGPEGDEEEIPIEKPFREKNRGENRPAKGKHGASRTGGGVSRLFIGLGRSGGVRPKDLVGAITGEAGIQGSQIGSIQISERFTIVEVSSDVADRVVQALKTAKIKGKKVTVRMDKAR
ncbi:MAG: DEAD/DEAH box helicase [Gemmatimonadetes bacterium]|nr:DEAD/DEAH box helicase [Gemmatimonadota bacterium]MDA1102962.1 DEAD/DEAH box helicase [Gemmatimonadota bacterium]